MSFHYELSYTMIRCFWISIALDIYINTYAHKYYAYYIFVVLDSRVQLPYFVYTSVLLESFPIYVSRDRKKMDKWINEKEKKKNASWLETVKNTLKLILLSVYGNVLMIDPVKKSRKHNARAICIYLKKKKKIYIYLSKIKVTWNFFHAASRRFIGKIGCIGKLCKEYGTSNAE